MRSIYLLEKNLNYCVFDEKIYMCSGVLIAIVWQYYYSVNDVEIQLKFVCIIHM